MIFSFTSRMELKSTPVHILKSAVCEKTVLRLAKSASVHFPLKKNLDEMVLCLDHANYFTTKKKRSAEVMQIILGLRHF